MFSSIDVEIPKQKFYQNFRRLRENTSKDSIKYQPPTTLKTYYAEGHITTVA
ncbi:hypothetical protein T4B_6124 [Trichinella pseudospiralis]|uniref:Uncharacterized protein n=1 Tax=Trichinella pseudospiralis TaxID=6337 RepID=A0A0V1GMR0_TRIPS|nr:hypothetical protein T4B_6124 [Trichinella pseudospiralis]